MKHTRQLLGFVLTFLFFHVSYGQKNALNISIIQDGQEYKIIGNKQDITLKKDGFKIMFNSFSYSDKHFYATQMDAFTDPKGAAMIHNKVKIENIPYFSPGTGMACDSDKQYSCLYIDKNLGECEYIIYNETGGDKRAALEGKSGDTLRLSWTINKFSLDNQNEIPMKEIQITDFYLVVFNDFNLNGKVDEGEYTIIHIHFT